MAWSEAGTVRETPSAGRAFAATAYDAERPPVEGKDEGQDPLIGKNIDHFEVRGLLGEGGMGRVYLAHDLSLNRPVALKLLRRELADNPTLMSRLVDEGRAQARLQHPNVVTIYYIGNFEGASYFVMEYVRGKTLAEVLEKDGALAWGDALEYVIQTARALATAHTRGMIHRDIKPSNILLGDISTGAQRAEVKVADFGLATSDETAAGRFVGTPYYAAPEQIAGAAPDLRSDIYTLAITFFELLTRKVPFKADSLEAIAELHRTAPRPQIADEVAPWRLRQLIAEMMDPDPQNRPQSYEALLARLESVRPKPRVAGGLLPRGVALAIDLMIFAPLGQIIAAAASWTQQGATQIWLGLFGTYYIVTHRLWGKTLGKRLLGLHVVGTTRRVRVPGLLLRFVVEFWGPLAALAIISLQIGAVTDLVEVKDRVMGGLGASPMPLWDRSVNALLRTMLVPNSIVAVPWLAGFLFVLVDRDRQTLHDRAARTRVIYEARLLDEEGKSAGV
ncbi:MAG TPA: protein kinase [Polyangia bacterium]